MTAKQPNKKFFVNKRIFLHLTSTAKVKFERTAELIRIFGGQIEQFLDHEVSYVLTDIPKNEWPPDGQDSMLLMARKYNVKLMSLDNLIVFCSGYVASQLSSDDDDDKGINIKNLKPPFIKHEDTLCRFAPSVREFVKWPEINLDSSLPVGRSFFSDPNFLITPTHSTNNNNHPNYSAQLTQQASRNKTPNPNNSVSKNSLSTANNQPPTNVNSNNMNGVVARIHNTAANHSITKNSTQHNNNNQNTTNNNVCPKLGVKRRHSVYCEICNQKVDDKIEDHIQTQTHKANTDKMCWDEVDTVIESLPGLSTLNKLRLTNMRPHDGVEQAEFLCLHKVDSGSPLFPGSDMPVQHWLTQTDGTRIRLM